MGQIANILVFQFSPDLTPHNFSYVHHMLVYLCNDGLALADRDASNECFTGASPSVDACTSSQLIGAWAVGGTVGAQHLYRITVLNSFFTPFKSFLSS